MSKRTLRQPKQEDKAEESLESIVLQEALILWGEEGKKANECREIVEMPNGDIGISIDVGNASLGFGRIYSHYLPISAVRLVLQDCEAYFNNFPVRYKDDDGEVKVRTLGAVQYAPGEREAHIKAMAVLAVYSLLMHLEGRIKDALRENFEDALVQVQAMLNNNVSEIFNAPTTLDIKDFPKDSANRRELRLRGFLEQLKSVEMLVRSKGGRPPKVTIEEVFNAVKKRGRGAGKMEVAFDLCVDERTITNKMKGANLDTWPDVIRAAFATHE